MQISLRSHLVAGIAAVVGTAGVVTAAPAAHVPALPVTANVALAALDNPIEELIGTAQLIQTYLLAGYYNGGDFPTPGAGEANWPGAGMDQTGGDVLNYLLAEQKTLGNYTNVGLLPYIVNANEPILQQLQVNWLGYLNTGLTGLTGAANAAAAGVWNFPAAAFEAAQLVLNGQFQEALTVMADAIVTPIATATTDLIGAAVEVARSVVAKLVAVVNVIPTNLTLFGGWLIGGSAYLVREAGELGRQWLQDLGSGNFEAAWNTAVGGLLGPGGLPGSAFNVSLGAGIQTGPILNPETDIRSNFIPSLRTAIQGTLWNTQEALTTTPPPMATPLAEVAGPAEATSAKATSAEATSGEAAAEATANATTESVAVETIEPSAVQQEVKADTSADSNPAPRRAPRAKNGAAESADAPAKAQRANRASRSADK